MCGTGYSPNSLKAFCTVTWTKSRTMILLGWYVPLTCWRDNTTWISGAGVGTVTTSRGGGRRDGGSSARCFRCLRWRWGSRSALWRLGLGIIEVPQRDSERGRLICRARLNGLRINTPELYIYQPVKPMKNEVSATRADLTEPFALTAGVSLARDGARRPERPQTRSNVSPLPGHRTARPRHPWTPRGGETCRTASPAGGRTNPDGDLVGRVRIRMVWWRY